jgi:hypothetical protein
VRIGTSPKRMILVVTISDKLASKTVNRLIHPSAWKRNSRKSRIASVLCSSLSYVEYRRAQIVVHKKRIIPSGRIMPPHRLGPPGRGDEADRLPMYGVLRSSLPASNSKLRQRYAVWGIRCPFLPGIVTLCTKGRTHLPPSPPTKSRLGRCAKERKGLVRGI